jgi:hypothetical protein
VGSNLKKNLEEHNGETQELRLSSNDSSPQHTAAGAQNMFIGDCSVALGDKPDILSS